MGQCIRGKFADAGLFPQPAPTDVAAVETPAVADESPAAEPEEQLTAPELDVAEPAASAGNIVAATFGLLRAEPDGSVVIAGSGTPGSEVEVYSDGDLLGSATVESSGDWVFVPDAPLSAGGVEITLAERGKEGRAAQSFVVVVDEDKTTQPLVVASTPGQASEILQGLERTQTAAVDPTATQPAAATTSAAAPAAAPAPATEASAPAEPAAVAPAPAATPAPAPAAETPVPGTTPAVPATPAPAVAAAPAPTPAPEAPVATTSTPAPTQSAPAAPAPAPASTPETAPAAPAATPTAPATAPAATPVAPDAPAVEAPAVPAAQLADIPPSIDAIEIEGDRTFFAGGGPEGGVVRLYVDDEFVADATIEGGRWLVEGGAVLDAPSQRIRADLLEPNSSDVIARAEVEFVVDMPATGEATAVANAEAAPAPPAATVAPAEPAPAPVAETPAAPATPPAVAPASGPVAAPAAEPAAEPSSAATPSQAAPAAMDPAPVAVADAPAPAAPATEPAAAPAPAAAEPAVPTMVAVSVGDPDAQRFASGKAIIRRGDNLWTIARRVYGEGIKYTTIYDANTGQIRDPDRIYPGQVFSLPQ